MKDVVASFLLTLLQYGYCIVRYVWLFPRQMSLPLPACRSSDDLASEVSSTTSTSKPWRVKGGKRPKKGKLRRVYRHLDDV